MAPLARSTALTVPLALTVVLTSTTRSQQPGGGQPADTTSPARKDTVEPPPRVVTPQLDFSGIAFGNYQYHTDSASRITAGGASPNKFEIERVYLTFRMPVGDHASIRATTDIFQQPSTATSGYYRGWAVRLKYGYLQYDFLHDRGGHRGFNALARIGMLHTVFIDYEEQFWPRFLSQVPTERNGFFSSADLGVATLLTLPARWGEVYGTITNGPGYTAPETDRFKDFALRVSLTPLRAASGLLETFTISPWVYKGWLGSKFVTGGTGQVGPVSDGLQRDRWGIFAGLRDHRLTAGGEYARRKDATETGANTVASPRTVVDSTGTLWSGFVIVRPFEFATPSARPAFGSVGAVFRYDRFTPNMSPSSPAYNGTKPYYNTLIAGIFWETTSRTTLAFDYQDQSPSSFPQPFTGSVAPTPQARTWFLHWQATF
jgi:hypothetical protein